MLKPTVSKLSPDLSERLKYISEKQVPAELKPIVGSIDNIVCASCAGDVIFRTFHNANTANKDKKSLWQIAKMNRFSSFETCLKL